MHPRAAREDHRRAAGQRLERREPPRLALVRVDEDVGGRVQLAQLVVRDRAALVAHTVLDAALADAPREHLGVARVALVGAPDHRPHVERRRLRERVDQVLETPVGVEDRRRQRDQLAVGEAEARARRRAVDRLEEEGVGAEVDDARGTPVAALDHLDLDPRVHHDRVAAARVAELGQAEAGAQQAPVRAPVGDQRQLGDDRALEERLVVAHPREGDAEAVRRQPAARESRRLVRVHELDVVRHERRDLAHPAEVALHERARRRRRLGDAGPHRAHVERRRQRRVLRLRQVVVAADRDPVTALLQLGGELQHVAHAAAAARNAADVIVDERELHGARTFRP